MTQWTDELKEEITKVYIDAEPTRENSADIVKQIAEEYNLSPNSVRMVLMQNSVYVCKAPKTKATEGGTKRVSKEDKIAELKSVIANKGKELDDAVLDKLTGKAAAYFISILS